MEELFLELKAPGVTPTHATLNSNYAPQEWLQLSQRHDSEVNSLDYYMGSNACDKVIGSQNLMRTQVFYSYLDFL